jgi:MSHA pilin protein MshC
VFLYSLIKLNDVRETKLSHHFFSKKFSNKTNGFSLIELILILIIISILSITALPKFFNVLSFSSQTYFDEVLNSIRYAQKLAVVMGCDVQVATTSNSLTLLARDACRTGNFNTMIHDPITGKDFVKIAPTDVNIASLDMPIYFDRIGRAHKTTGQVTNANLIVASRGITIIAETGFVYEEVE